MRIKKILIGVVILIIGIVGCRLLKGGSHDSKESQKIINPHYGSIQTIITTTATVLPKNRLEIKPTVTGRVEKVLVQEGQMVKAGEILAWISSTDRAALLDSARGQGDKEFKYWQDVYKPIPLLAPIDGQVIVATTQPGQTVTTSDAVIVLSDHLIVRAQVDETDIGKIQLKQAASISLDSYPDTKIQAAVDHLYYESKTVNNVTIYEVDLLPQEIPAFFRSGMNANVDFIIQRKENILLLPVAAVTKNDDQAFVWLEGQDAKKPIKQQIQTGITDDKNIEITSGLKEDDSVILRTKKFSLNKNKGGSNPFMASRPAGGGSGRSR
jgi:macrolide-specific efflux system membrane fusion protein